MGIRYGKFESLSASAFGGAADLAKRAEKEKSRGSGTMEKYAKVIAQQTGIAIEKLTDVLSAKDIKPATEGHKAQ